MSGKQLLPLSGVVAVLLTVAALIVGGESPETDDSLGEVISYYSDNEDEVAIASALLGLGAFFFLLFSTAVASLVRRPGDAGIAGTFCLAGGIVFSIGMTIFAGLGFSAADAVGEVEPTVIQSINVLSSDMFFTVAVGAGAFMLGAGTGTLRSDALPSWLSWAAIVIGIVAITPLGFIGFIGLGIWTLVASVLLYMRAGASGPASSKQPAS